MKVLSISNTNALFLPFFVAFFPVQLCPSCNLFHCSPLAIVMIDEEKSNTRNLKIDESDKKKKNPMVHVNEQALVLLYR